MLGRPHWQAPDLGQSIASASSKCDVDTIGEPKEVRVPGATGRMTDARV